MEKKSFLAEETAERRLAVGRKPGRLEWLEGRKWRREGRREGGRGR